MKATWLRKIAGLGVILLLAAVSLQAEDEGWINNSLTLKVTPRISLKFTQETHSREIAFADTYMHNWQGGVVWKLSSRVHAAASYKQEVSEFRDSYLHESRFTLEGGWKLPLSRKSRLDARFRMEVRSFDVDSKTDHLRFRLRLRFQTQVNLGGLTLKPFVATEPFADTLADKINRNRFYLGFGVPLSSHVQWVVNYIRQDSSGKETLHILNTGVDLKF